VQTTGNKPNGLFFAGDLGQRIFQAPFSWSSLGVNVRGRSSTLRINYRTSHQIRSQADRLLSPEVSDVDGNIEKRNDAQSVFNGPEPIVFEAPDQLTENQRVATWVKDRLREGIPARQIAVFVRSELQIDRARKALH
jgi:superfamily I DNA/RNA helicase